MKSSILSLFAICTPALATANWVAVDSPAPSGVELTNSQDAERGYIGVRWEYADGAMVIKSVLPGGGAEAAGLVAGDRAVQVNRIDLSQEGAERQLADLKAGDSIRIKIKRDGRSLGKRVVLSSLAELTGKVERRIRLDLSLPPAEKDRSKIKLRTPDIRAERLEPPEPQQDRHRGSDDPVERLVEVHVEVDEEDGSAPEMHRIITRVRGDVDESDWREIVEKMRASGDASELRERFTRLRTSEGAESLRTRMAKIRDGQEGISGLRERVDRLRKATKKQADEFDPSKMLHVGSQVMKVLKENDVHPRDVMKFMQYGPNADSKVDPRTMHKLGTQVLEVLKENDVDLRDLAAKAGEMRERIQARWGNPSSRPFELNGSGEPICLEISNACPPSEECEGQCPADTCEEDTDTCKPSPCGEGKATDLWVTRRPAKIGESGEAGENKIPATYAWTTTPLGEGAFVYHSLDLEGGRPSLLYQLSPGEPSCDPQARIKELEATVRGLEERLAKLEAALTRLRARSRK